MPFYSLIVTMAPLYPDMYKLYLKMRTCNLTYLASSKDDFTQLKLNSWAFLQAQNFTGDRCQSFKFLQTQLVPILTLNLAAPNVSPWIFFPTKFFDIFIAPQRKDINLEPPSSSQHETSFFKKPEQILFFWENCIQRNFKLKMT